MNTLIRQAGAIPWRTHRGRLEVLLITNTRGSKWMVPKGFIEPFETPRECAAKEAFEEAGIRGDLHDQPVGHWVYRKRGALHGVEVFPLLVDEQVDEFPENSQRQRRWVSWDQAVGEVSDKNLRPILEQLPLFLSDAGLVSPAIALSA